MGLPIDLPLRAAMGALPELDDVLAGPGCAGFVALAPGGPARLQVHGDAVEHAVDAAIELHRCDALLRAVDAWTGLALEWRWDASLWSLPSGGTHACARWSIASDDRVQGLLELPWTLLRTLAPPALQADVRLNWPSVSAVLAASQLRVTALELSHLEPGGAVLLPGSWRPDWRGALRAADEASLHGVGVPVEMQDMTALRLAAYGDPGLPAVTDGPGDDDKDTGLPCEIRLALPRALPADRLAGWCVGEPLVAPGLHASLWRCERGAAAPLALATGRLMPWGEGWALHIESVCAAGATH
jgi:hypothetical protein